MFSSQVHIVHGLHTAGGESPIEYGASSQILPAEYGADDASMALRYNASFALDAAAQAQVVRACDAAARDAEMVPSGEVYCLLRDVKRWAGSDAFPYATEAELRVAIEAFYGSSAYAEIRATHGDAYDDRTGFVLSLIHISEPTRPY